MKAAPRTVGGSVSAGGSSFYQAAPADWSPDDTCAATEWTDWSACSAPCGRRGFRARTRRFFNRLGRKKEQNLNIDKLFFEPTIGKTL